MANYDIFGNIAILKFNGEFSKEEKLKKAHEILNQYKGVRTILEKTDKVHGRLRTIKTRLLLGEKNLIAEYNENGCRFKLNVETCYFSPRLAHERLEIAKIVSRRKNARVLVMFSGVAPFPIVIARNSSVKKIVSVELGKDCEKYARENIKINKFERVIEHIQGDVKKVIPKLMKKEKKFDIVIMPRPNLSETFLKEGLMASRKGTLIIYYGFSPEAKKQEMIDELESQAKKLKRKIKILIVKEAGDIAPYEHRYRIEILVGN